MSKQEESWLYEFVRKAIEQSFKVQGYEVDFEITGHPRGKFIPERFLSSEMLLKHRRDRLPTPDIMGLVWRSTRQDNKKLVIVEVKKKPNYRDIFQTKGYDELYNSDFTYLISQHFLYMTSPKVLDFIEESPELLRTRKGNDVCIMTLYRNSAGEIHLGQLGPEAGILPTAII